MLVYLLVKNYVNIIAVDFNFHLSKVSSSKLLDHMKRYAQVVNKPPRMSGSQIDHIYIKSSLLEEFHAKTIIENIYVSDRGALRIAFQKKEVDFTVSK